MQATMSAIAPSSHRASAVVQPFKSSVTAPRAASRLASCTVTMRLNRSTQRCQAVEKQSARDANAQGIGRNGRPLGSTAPLLGGDSSGLAGKLLGCAAAGLLLLSDSAAWAGAEKIAEFDTSGFLFKDSVQIVELTDKAVDGVTLYLTDYKRSITERLGRDPFSDPSMASVTCVPIGQVTIKDLAAARKQEEIYSEMKTLNLLQSKALRVRRVFDEKNGVLIYVAYSTRFNSANDESERGFSSRYRTSVCAVPLAREAPALADAAQAAPALAAQ